MNHTNPPTEVSIQNTWILARDGRRLAATEYAPVIPNGRAVIINGATAVKRNYYDRYARFLAGIGFNVLTYDYRGIGGSVDGSIRTESGQMHHWGTVDIPSAIDHISVIFPDRRLLVVSHSAGGQLFGLADNNARVSAMLAISAQSGYWKHWRGPHRWALAILWFGLIPGLTRIFAYFPAKSLGLGENLPGGVAREWARWCRHPDYIVDEKSQPMRHHFTSYHGTICTYMISDDWMAPRIAVEALMKFYQSAAIELRVVGPDSIGKKTLGHFGFFRESARPLWQETAEWLCKQ